MTRTSNTQLPTSNIERMLLRTPAVQCWTLDVRCSKTTMHFWMAKGPIESLSTRPDPATFPLAPLRMINIEEKPDEIVGRRRAPSDPFKMAMGLQSLAGELRKSFGTVPIPKGVYRFKTHEEADQWMWTMLARHRKT